MSRDHDWEAYARREMDERISKKDIQRYKGIKMNIEEAKEKIESYWPKEHHNRCKTLQDGPCDCFMQQYIEVRETLDFLVAEASKVNQLEAMPACPSCGSTEWLWLDGIDEGNAAKTVTCSCCPRAASSAPDPTGKENS